MGLSRRARWGAAAAAVVLVGMAGALAFGPLARRAVVAEAAKRGLEVKVRAARPGWFRVVLQGVEVRLQGVDGLRAELPALSVELSATMSPRALDVEGGEVALQGDPEALRHAVETWRSSRPAGASGGQGPRLRVAVRDVEVRWTGSRGSGRIAGLHATRDEEGQRLGFSEGDVRLDGRSIALASGEAVLDAHGNLQRASVGKAEIAWTLRELQTGKPIEPAPPSTGDLAPPPLPPTHPVATNKKGRSGASPAAPPGAPTSPSGEAAEPFLAMPDLHVLRTAVTAIADVVRRGLPEGAVLNIDGLSLRLLGGTEERISLGPGPLEVSRRAEQVEVTFSTRSGATGTPLSLHAVLPANDDEVQLSLEGGPVPMSLLGVRAAVLQDTDRATVAGKGRVALEGSGKSLTFDAQVTFRGLAILEPRICPDVIRGLDFEARARGVLSDRGELRLDEVEAAMGALKLRAHGTFEQTADHVAAALDYELPLGSCQAMLESAPTSLLPTLRGAHMGGTFRAEGKLLFDTRTVDDMTLEYTVEDRCRLMGVPDELDRDRFAKPFVQRVYGPDGKVTEEVTGPTTENWTELDHISPFMQAAVLTTEDGAFFHHRGFNHAAIRNALIADIKARRFVRGASTITMQLAKNLFLSRDKTLSRKLEELILTDYLEQTFTKDEMMELYLNVIEFGPNIYGITAAADHYFGRRPDELNLAECLFLSSILPKPVHYHVFYEQGQLPDSWLKGIRARMAIAQKTGKISQAELAEGLTETVVFHRPNTPRPAPRPPVVASRAGDDAAAGWQETN